MHSASVWPERYSTRHFASRWSITSNTPYMSTTLSMEVMWRSVCAFQSSCHVFHWEPNQRQFGRSIRDIHSRIQIVQLVCKWNISEWPSMRFLSENTEITTLRDTVLNQARYDSSSLGSLTSKRSMKCSVCTIDSVFFLTMIMNKLKHHRKPVSLFLCIGSKWTSCKMSISRSYILNQYVRIRGHSINLNQTVVGD